VFHEVSCKIPFIHGCIVQGYGIEPRVFTDAEPDDPTFMIPVSNDPSVAIVVAVAVAVAVCGSMSLLFQVTLELADMVLGFGT
jgi:hypothetical protein